MSSYLGIGVSPGNVPVYHGNDLKVIDMRVRLAELILRCLICGLAILSAVLIGTDTQVKEIFLIQKEAKFTYMKALVFLVITNGLATAYSPLQLLRCVLSMIGRSVLFNKPLAWVIFSGDKGEGAGAKPLPVEEETVKEVLSETPIEKGSSHKVEKLNERMQELKIDSRAVIKPKCTEEIASEASVVSDLGSCTESFSTTGIENRDDDGEVNQRIPARVPRRRQNTSDISGRRLEGKDQLRLDGRRRCSRAGRLLLVRFSGGVENSNYKKEIALQVLQF